MCPKRRRILSLWAAAGVLVTFAGVLPADENPLSSDADGNVWFRTPNDTVLKVAANRDVSIDAKVLINCRERPQGEVETRLGKAECRGDFVEVEDSFGNELEVYPSHAEAEDDDGNKYEVMLGGSPLSVSVSGDWRGAGASYSATDTDRILMELGAVEKDDVIRLALAGDVLFDFDSTAIRGEAAGQLAKAAHVIRQRSVGKVHVVGHTDSVGADDYNQKLSQKRAEAVMSWLSRHEGIPPEVMAGRGMGSTKPVAYNTMPDGSDNPAGRAKNRRVEILLAEREGVDLNAVVSGAVHAAEQAVDTAGAAVRTAEQAVDMARNVAAGIGVKSQLVGDETGKLCKSGDTCNYGCLEGNCHMTCESDATCNFSCPGGDCELRCRPGAACSFGCTGGNCHFVCAEGSTCKTSCLGGDCTRSKG